jgi:hypothetical protein
MTLIGSQTKSRSWVGSPPVTVVKETNTTNVNWACLCVSAVEEINFLYIRHVFHKVIENINVIILF